MCLVHLSLAHGSRANWELQQIMHSSYASIRHLQCNTVQATRYKIQSSLYKQLRITTTRTSTLGGSDAVKGDIRIPLMPKLNVLAFICMDRELPAAHESIWALLKSSYIAACKDLTQKHVST